MSSKSLVARCIQRWKFRFKPVCDSKVSPHWRKHHLKTYFREYAVITADSMVWEMAESNAKADFGIVGWSPEFSAWFDERREYYMKEARQFLDEEADNDKIDYLIQEEIDCWGN
ncbi:hypothetical protein [Erwinia pyrifoliae]|uniref:hypothetical protein n=1 Tax=Erwinia pyrifoliae TaxID=79967 RepID=UPI00223AC8DC|nr:hypothetical protein [Erwinia pyrifoliae]MCT2385143.1 hypothetical protein [Erwinia pyrifoliae]MCU8585633.1 hypothetical protein [Erwinia pyrifoliae]